MPQLIEYSYGSSNPHLLVCISLNAVWDFIVLTTRCCRMGIAFYQRLHLIYKMPQQGEILCNAQFARHSMQYNIPINEDRRLYAAVLFRGNDGYTGAFTSFTGFSFTTPYDTFFVLNLLFITRYMGPKGPWQRQSRCPLRSSDELF